MSQRKMLHRNQLIDKIIEENKRLDLEEEAIGGPSPMPDEDYRQEAEDILAAFAEWTDEHGQTYGILQ